MASTTRAQLLDDEQAITPKFEQVLLDIFKKYATLRNGASDIIENYVILPEGLERFGRDTNGQPLPEDQLEEMRTFLDCDNDGNLLFKGFMQMYSLQTSSEEEETWKDLRTHGYNENLDFTGSSR
ncbi:hypothetical protein P389DRAFT_173520 [Cystobasidium minutum MCA 4210]|uniref:uncharacterized protein n=1 Tax=Cystobasidium minutum MCA 4210 TaxID=1397322 RepID=UPI0034CDAF2F|eukprot:jgi/Rhomi1/173520/fgenesh1_kg.6_\